MEKYELENSHSLMPIALQVSHAIADDYHVAMFFEKLQEELHMANGILKVAEVLAF